MKIFLKSLILLFIIFAFSCTSKDNGAQKRLENARTFYSEKEYSLAKLEIDSIKIIYPKAFDQIRAGLALLDSVRRAENVQNIAISDSLIVIRQASLDSLKKYFVYQIDKKYQDKGVFIPKEINTGGQLTATTLRSGVSEDGQIYLESVFVGSQKHNKIRVSTKDASKESLSLSDGDDGFCYRFSNLGKQYEILKFTGANDNGVAEFISINKDKALSITLNGQEKFSYTLSQTIKNAVAKSYHLSNIIQQLDSLKSAKEQSEFKNYYLDNKSVKGSEQNK